MLQTALNNFDLIRFDWLCLNVGVFANFFINLLIFQQLYFLFSVFRNDLHWFFDISLFSYLSFKRRNNFLDFPILFHKLLMMSSALKRISRNDESAHLIEYLCVSMLNKGFTFVFFGKSIFFRFCPKILYRENAHENAKLQCWHWVFLFYNFTPIEVSIEIPQKSLKSAKLL